VSPFGELWLAGTAIYFFPFEERNRDLYKRKKQGRRKDGQILFAAWRARYKLTRSAFIASGVKLGPAQQVTFQRVFLFSVIFFLFIFFRSYFLFLFLFCFYKIEHFKIRIVFKSDHFLT
jgi:hypothetical protein